MPIKPIVAMQMPRNTLSFMRAQGKDLSVFHLNPHYLHPLLFPQCKISWVSPLLYSAALRLRTYRSCCDHSWYLILLFDSFGEFGAVTIIHVDGLRFHEWPMACFFVVSHGQEDQRDYDPIEII